MQSYSLEIKRNLIEVKTIMKQLVNEIKYKV
jgi:hypothetical protein